VPDKIWGLRYGDRIYATSFGADADILNGGRGNDTLNSQDGDRRDTVNGGYGYDECLVDRPIEAGWGCDIVGYAIE
jgi:Ca2+-binding RTX toxin-like protein